MGKQQAISEKRFNGLSWKQEDGVFKAQVSVSRGLFGLFYVDFECQSVNDKMAVSIKSLSYDELEMPRTTYETSKNALEGIDGFFREIDELVLKVSMSARASAMFAYKTVLRNEIKRIKEST